MPQENDLLQRFIDNERKSKQTTLALVLLFMLAALGVLFLAFKLAGKNQQVTQLESNNKEYQRIIDSLSKVITRPFILKDSINNKRTEELIQEVKLRDTLIQQVEKNISNHEMGTDGERIQQQIRKINVTSQRILKPQKSYTVYIQYNSPANSEVRQIERLRQRLQELGYNVPDAEFRKGNFKTTYVCYFHDEDRGYAEEVFENLSRIYRRAEISQRNIKAPTKQIEIWLNSEVD